MVRTYGEHILIHVYPVAESARFGHIRWASLIIEGYLWRKTKRSLPHDLNLRNTRMMRVFFGHIILDSQYEMPTIPLAMLIAHCISEIIVRVGAYFMPNGQILEMKSGWRSRCGGRHSQRNYGWVVMSFNECGIS